MTHGHTHVPVLPVQSFTLPVRMLSGIFSQIYAEAERNASSLAIAEAQPYKWRDSGKYTQKPSAEQMYLLTRLRITGLRRALHAFLDRLCSTNPGK